MCISNANYNTAIFGTKKGIKLYAYGKTVLTKQKRKKYRVNY